MFGGIRFAQKKPWEKVVKSREFFATLKSEGHVKSLDITHITRPWKSKVFFLVSMFFRKNQQIQEASFKSLGLPGYVCIHLTDVTHINWQ